MGELGRRTGLGITAEGDMIAALGLKYGTTEATEFAVKIHKTLALSAYSSSIELASERGSFPIYDYNKETENPFINRLFNDDPVLKENMLKYGRRNIACLTIAPTGTVSLMTQTTSGIEPVFMPVYKRRRKVNPNDINAHVDFVDETTGESFEEYVVFHPKFKVWMDINGIKAKENYSQKELEDLISISPYAHATANDVDWKEKVRMQGMIQKYVDHSISVTVNLPNSASEELVNELYLTAWKSGCKGCTIYRDGSRAGVLVSVSSKDNKNDEKIIENRPKSLNADIIRFKNNKEQWIAFVGKLDNGQPYEIFTGLIDEEEGLFDIPKSVTSGKIVKKILEDGKKSYDFEFSNKKGNKIIIEGLNSKFNPEYWNYSKLLSSVLRYHMPMNYVLHLVDSLDLHEEGINSWKSGVKRALKKYIKDGDEVVGGEDKCPDCGAKLRYENGCVICPNCGYSKCG
jgi:ribonucleoside-diphosphate reductase alpha chain